MAIKTPVLAKIDISKGDVLLVDAMNCMWRCAHAAGKPDLSGGGVKTHIAYMALQSILGAKKKMSPGADVFIVWEGSRRIRKELYPPYKVKRDDRTPEMEEMKDEVYAQCSILKEIIACTAFANVYPDKRYEADDGLFTLATRLHRKGYRVVILTSDQDLWGAIQPTSFPASGWVEIPWVAVLNPRPNKPWELVDTWVLKEKYHLKSSQVASWKAIAGDSSDEYPGVPGIGEKTAAAWLETYGAMADIVSAYKIGALKGKRAKALADAFDEGAGGDLFTFIKIAQLMHCDLTIDSGTADADDLLTVLEKYQIRSLMPENRLRVLLQEDFDLDADDWE